MTDRTPRDTRFKRGQSGNPKGRPRGARGNKAILERVAGERHAVTIHGERQRLSTFQLVLRVIRDKSIKGNSRAIRAVGDLATKYGEQEAPDGVGFLVVPERLTAEEWEAEMLAAEEKAGRI